MSEETKLVKQPTATPTRKMWAVLATGVIMSVITTLWNAYPEYQIVGVDIPQIEVWVTAAVMAAAGYFTKEKA